MILKITLIAAAIVGLYLVIRVLVKNKALRNDVVAGLKTEATTVAGQVEKGVNQAVTKVETAIKK